MALPPRPLDPLALPLHGTQLIEASAGTGKTYTIALLYVRLVVEQARKTSEILVVTFTEAAAAELRERIRGRLRQAVAAFAGGAADPDLARLVATRDDPAADVERLQHAVRTFDEASISTIHGFCHRVLQDSAFETGVPFETELIANEGPLLDLAVRDFWARKLYRGDPLFVGYLLRRRVTPARLAKLADIATSHPEAPVIPDSVELDDHPDVAPFLRAFEHAREVWIRARDEVEEILASAQGLYKKQYPKQQVPAWLQEMDAFLREPEPGSSLGFPAFDKFCPETLTRYTKNEFRRRGEVPSHEFFDACAELKRAREPLAQNLDLRHVALKRWLIAYVRRELPRRKRAAGVQSFDDLLHLMDRALRRRGGKALADGIRQRYRAALIDEFQDTDPVQYRIFKAIYGGTQLPLCLIGDPKQAIYGFRGADVFAYIQAARAVGPRRKHTMDTNWRSDAGLVGALDHLFAVRRPFWLEDIDFVRVGARPGADAGVRVHGEAVAPLELRFMRREHAQCRGKQPQITMEWADANVPRLCAADIAAFLGSEAQIRVAGDWRAVHAGDIAVLVRKNSQAQAVQAALRRLGIPGVVYGDASVYETREADELHRVLSAVAEPTHSGFLRAAITSQMLGVTGDALEAMGTEDAPWNRWVGEFRRWHSLWAERGFIQMFRALLAEARVTPRLLALQDGERRMTNLLHLAELLHGAAVSEHLGPAGLLRWFQDQKRIDQAMAEAVKLRLERDDQAVQLITIHRAKGLEYPIVYCPYLWEPEDLRADEVENLLFHDPDDDNRLKLDITLKPTLRRLRDELANVAQARFETDAEAMRLLYVALTRARHRCVVVWGQFDRAHRSGLGYLLHAPSSEAAFGWDPELIASNIRQASDDAMLSWLEKRAHPTWRVSMLHETEASTAPRPTIAAPTLRHRSARAGLDRWFRTSSFTGMTGETKLAAFERRAHDELVSVDQPVAPPPSAAARVALADFPRGATPGNFFHDVLEHLDFGAPTAELERLVDTKLQAYGFGVEPWRTTVCRAVRAVLGATVAPGVSLQEVEAADRRAELGFLFPVAADSDGAVVTRRDLARVFHEYGHGLPPAYAQGVHQLGFAPLRGFLKGFIDLVFRHEGRYYIADYKTNHLGDTEADYNRAALMRAMAEHHYVLQYHLYVVALVRHLRARIPDFDYARHFGGVAYLFVRGMGRGSAGVYFERPPAERIAALSAVMEGPTKPPRTFAGSTSGAKARVAPANGGGS